MTASQPPRPASAGPAATIAIVGMAVRVPGAHDLDGLRALLARGTPAPTAPLAERWADLDVELPPALNGARGHLLDVGQPDVSRYRIPPVQARSLATMQMLLLELAEQALADAAWPATRADGRRTDVIAGTCFGFDRTFVNACRIESARLVAAYVERLGLDPGPAADLERTLRRRLARHFKASAYDRVGEMASTIPSRVSMHFKLQGRCLTVEAADGTAFAAVDTAVAHLRAGRSDAAVVMVGQRLESPAVAAAMALKGLVPEAPSPLGGAGPMALGEGAGALVLRRLDDARHSGQRIYATIEGIGQAQAPRRGAWRYAPTPDARIEAVKRALRDADRPAAEVAFVECAATGLPADERVELDALGAAFDRSVPVGSTAAVLGRTFAFGGLAGLIKAALAVHDGRMPGQAPGPEAPLPIPIAATTLDDDARIGVQGSTITGSSWHVIVGPAGAPERPAVAVDRGVPIAIVAADGCFSQAADAETWWSANVDGEGAIGPLPADVLPRALFHSPRGLDPLGSYTDIGASIVPADRPPRGLGLVPRRWLDMDPAQRAVISSAARMWRSLDEAHRPRGRGAVTIASNLSLGRERALHSNLALGAVARRLVEGGHADRADVMDAALADVRAALPTPGRTSLDSTLASGTAAHLAHAFGLDAVPVAVEAACASSMAAIDMAVRGLRDGRYDYAITGGVELACTPRDMVLCSALGLLSRTRISPFCTHADGFSPGDGAAVFLLMRLDDARAAGHPVRAVIRGIGAASDARSLVAPDVDGQSLAIRRAFADVDFGPGDVQFIETHGTGTALGDQVEVLSLALEYCADRRPSPLAISSAKSMIGHTFAAAGSAGLLRTVLALGHRTLPPTAGLTRLNPRLSLGALPARLVTEAEPWAAPGDGPRRAGLSAFGTGGIDYHLLLEEAP